MSVFEVVLLRLATAVHTNCKTTTGIHNGNGPNQTVQTTGKRGHPRNRREMRLEVVAMIRRFPEVPVGMKVDEVKSVTMVVLVTTNAMAFLDLIGPVERRS